MIAAQSEYAPGVCPNCRLYECGCRPEVVTLCGSTRFFEDFGRVNERLTLEGKIVLTVAIISTSERLCSQPDCGKIHGGLPPDVKQRLDELHLRKIEMSDRIHVINKDGYTGDSTRREIAHAQKLGKRITWEWPS